MSRNSFFSKDCKLLFPQIHQLTKIELNDFTLEEANNLLQEIIQTELFLTRWYFELNIIISSTIWDKKLKNSNKIHLPKLNDLKLDDFLLKLNENNSIRAVWEDKGYIFYFDPFGKRMKLLRFITRDHKQTGITTGGEFYVKFLQLYFGDPLFSNDVRVLFQHMTTDTMNKSLQKAVDQISLFDLPPEDYISKIVNISTEDPTIKSEYLPEYYFIPFSEHPEKKSIEFNERKITFLTINDFSNMLISSKNHKDSFNLYWRSLINIAYGRIIDHYPKLLLSIYSRSISKLSEEIKDISLRIEESDYQPAIQLCGSLVEDILEMIYFYQYKSPLEREKRTIGKLLKNDKVKTFLQNEFGETNTIEDIYRMKNLRNEYSHSIVNVEPSEYQAIEMQNKANMVLDWFKAWLFEKHVE